LRRWYSLSYSRFFSRFAAAQRLLDARAFSRFAARQLLCCSRTFSGFSACQRLIASQRSSWFASYHALLRALAKQKSEETISFLELHEIESILKLPDTAKPEGLRDRAIMETLFSSGMRISELVALDVDQVSLLMRGKDSSIRTYELSIVGKGRHIRTIFISPRAAHSIRVYLARRGDDLKPLFINTRSRNPDHKRLTPRSIQLMIAKYARLAGLSKKVTPHTLRHTYATDLLSHGADLRSVQELLGHKNVSTTQVYTHVTNKRLRDIHERFHGGQDLAQ